MTRSLKKDKRKCDYGRLVSSMMYVEGGRFLRETGLEYDMEQFDLETLVKEIKSTFFFINITCDGCFTASLLLIALCMLWNLQKDNMGYAY